MPASGEGAGGGEEKRPVLTLASLKKEPRVRAYIAMADKHLGAIGYTEHGERHANLVSSIAQNILRHLNQPAREAELAGIGGFLHDIGNVISRENHAQAGAVLVERILRELDFPVEETAEVIAAIGNHHEESGDPVSRIAAAVILADKSDVHRTRVRNPDMIRFDIHDRVNYAATNSFIRVDDAKKTIMLELTIDTSISHLMEYFEIFLSRMLVSRRAANFLSCKFELVINGSRMV